MTHLWAAFPVLEMNNLGFAWRVEVDMAPDESHLMEILEVKHTGGRRVRFNLLLLLSLFLPKL